MSYYRKNEIKVYSCLALTLAPTNNHLVIGYTVDDVIHHIPYYKSLNSKYVGIVKSATSLKCVIFFLSQRGKKV